MRERWLSADGWAVEVVRLTATPNRQNGPRIRVTHHGSPLPMSATRPN
jgi:hypothetical protein